MVHSSQCFASCDLQRDRALANGACTGAALRAWTPEDGARGLRVGATLNNPTPKSDRLPGRGARRCCTALALVLAAPRLLWLRPACLPICEASVTVVRHRCRGRGRAALAGMMATPHLFGL